MSLFAVVVTYIALRLLWKKEKVKPAIAGKEINEVQTEKAGQSMSADYHKTQSASAEDWATVIAIAAKYAPALKVLEAKRKQLLEETNSKWASISPEAVVKRIEQYKAQKAIRDKETRAIGGNLSVSFQIRIVGV